MCSSDSVRRLGYSETSGSASRKDGLASAKRVPCGVTISLFGRPNDRKHPHPLSLPAPGPALPHVRTIRRSEPPGRVASRFGGASRSDTGRLGTDVRSRDAGMAASATLAILVARSAAWARHHSSRSGASRTGIVTRRLWHWLLEAGSGGGVRVWQITSGGRRPLARRSPAERANVAYAHAAAPTWAHGQPQFASHQ